MGLAELEAELSDKDINNIELPYVIKNHILMSPGSWNNFKYTNDTISNAFVSTNWNKKNSSLFWEHSDKSAKEWVGDVKELKFLDGNLLGDVYVIDKQLAINLAYGAKFGISPKIAGLAGNDKVVRDATFENFSIVLNPAVKTTFLNSEIKEIENKKEDVIMVDEKVNEAKENKELSEIKELMKNLAEEVKFVKEEMAKKKLKEDAAIEDKRLSDEKELAELRKHKLEEEDEAKKKKDEEDAKKKKYPYPEEMNEDEIKELEEHLKLMKSKLSTKDKLEEGSEEKEEEKKEEEKKGPEGDVEADMGEKKEEKKELEEKKEDKKELEEKKELGEKQEARTLRELDPTTSSAKYSCAPSNADVGMATYLKSLIK